MSVVDWEEVKRLAADFQKAQQSHIQQELSERNCVEIITKLIELNLLEVIFTTDGKEYITPEYLVKEIRDELFVHGGRVSLVELSHSLNVDLSHITAKANEVERSSPGCTVIMGQLIDRQYVNTMCQEINEKLQTHGQINVSELTRTYDLPSEYILGVVEKNLGKLIHGKQDKSDRRIFFTDQFIEHNNALVRGALIALTRPTQVSTILQICDFRERDFFVAFEHLKEDKKFGGVLTGKQGGNTLYVPYVYTKQQNEWVNNFYSQNGYLEYDALIRLGITDPIPFIRRHFAQEGFIELETCAIGPSLIQQIENAVEEALISGSYLDMSIILPSVFSNQDITKVIEIVQKRCKSKATMHIFSDTVIVTSRFLDELMKEFLAKGIVQKKGKEALDDGTYMQAIIARKLAKQSANDHDEMKTEKREERRKKAAGGKSGGGTQGRETKTKSLKSKKDKRGGRGDDWSDDEADMKKKSEDKAGTAAAGKLELFTVEEISKDLSAHAALKDEDETLIDAMAEYLLPGLNRAAEEAAAEEHEKLMQTAAGSRRKLHADLQDKIDSALVQIRLYDRGLKLLSPQEQTKLHQHLVKTMVTSLVNALFSYVGQDLCSRPPNEQVTTSDVRAKIINELPGDYKESYTKLHKTIPSGSTEDILTSFEAAASQAGFLIRKPDKKKEKALLHAQRENLLGELGKCNDPGQVLYLTVAAIFQVAHQNIIHASGKHLSAIIDYLKPSMSTQDYKLLSNFQELIVKELTTDNEDDKAQIESQLSENLNAIRDLGMNYKRFSPEKTQDNK